VDFCSVVSIVTAGVLVSVTAVSALGISPSLIELGDLVSSSVVKSQVVIVRANPSETEYYKITKQGSGSSYVNIASDTVELPRGQQQVPIPVEIAPRSAATGAYKTTLRFDATQDPHRKTPGDSVNTATISVTSTITFTVTNKQKKEFIISSVVVPDTEERQPIGFSFQIKNTGNVDARPDSIMVSFVDQTDPSHHLNETIDMGAFPIVPPLAQKTVLANLTGTLSQGSYLGHFVFSTLNNPVYTQDAMLRVYPAGSLQQNAELTMLSSNKKTIELGEIASIQVFLKNTGEVPMESSVAMDVERGGKRIDVLKSDKKVIQKNQEAQFSFDWKPELNGTYTLSASAEYGIKKTPSKTIQVVVGSGGLGRLGGARAMTLALLLGGVIAIVWIVMKKFIHYHA